MLLFFGLKWSSEIIYLNSYRMLINNKIYIYTIIISIYFNLKLIKRLSFMIKNVFFNFILYSACSRVVRESLALLSNSGDILYWVAELNATPALATRAKKRKYNISETRTHALSHLQSHPCDYVTCLCNLVIICTVYNVLKIAHI